MAGRPVPRYDDKSVCLNMGEAREGGGGGSGDDNNFTGGAGGYLTGVKEGWC